MKTINKIETYPDHNIRQIKENGKTYYICNICGRKSFRAIKAYKKIWCVKHYKQMKKYGRMLDDNPRTILDKNEIRICGKVAYMDLYSIKCGKVAEVKFDSEDVNKVRYTKWKLSNSGYAMNTPKFKGQNKHFSRVVLNTNEFVDHINHNTLDNRKENLRIVTKSQNQMNSNYKGITLQPSGKYMAHIKLNQKMLNLGVYVDKEEALYARWYAEKIVFKEFSYPKEEPKILNSSKEKIQEYVNKKVQRL